MPALPALKCSAPNKGMKPLQTRHRLGDHLLWRQYYMPGDPKYKADMPWTDRRVRQAMNMAVNRQELRDTIFRGKGTPMYVSGFEASLEGWNPAWAERFDSLWHNPTRAKELLGCWLSTGTRPRQIALVHQSRRGRASTGGRSPGDLF